MAEVPITRGLVVYIDDDDLTLVARHRWRAVPKRDTWYAHTTLPRDAQGARRTLRMHRLILGIADPDVHVDHADRNGLNNQRSNLRIATRGQNRANSVSTVGDSIFKGVSSRDSRWVAKAGGEFLGYFATEQDAALVYDRVALERYGDFALINFPGATDYERSAANKRRGISPDERTACPAGHLYEGENLIVEASTGRRRCRICKRATSAASARSRRSRKGPPDSDSLPVRG